MADGGIIVDGPMLLCEKAAQDVASTTSALPMAAADMTVGLLLQRTLSVRGWRFRNSAWLLFILVVLVIVLVIVVVVSGSVSKVNSVVL